MDLTEIKSLISEVTELNTVKMGQTWVKGKGWVIVYHGVVRSCDSNMTHTSIPGSSPLHPIPTPPLSLLWRGWDRPVRSISETCPGVFSRSHRDRLSKRSLLSWDGGRTGDEPFRLKTLNCPSRLLLNLTWLLSWILRVLTGNKVLENRFTLLSPWTPWVSLTLQQNT